MTIEKMKEIRNCLTEESIEAFDAVYEDFSTNHRLENIPLLIAALTEDSNQMESIDHFHSLLNMYMIENPLEAIPLFLKNIEIASPDAISFLGISINRILSEDKEFEILLNSIVSGTLNKNVLINVLNHIIVEYEYTKKHNLFLDAEVSEIRLERTNYILGLLSAQKE